MQNRENCDFTIHPYIFFVISIISVTYAMYRAYIG